jgi:hypothetical protein
LAKQKSSQRKPIIKTVNFKYNLSRWSEGGNLIGHEYFARQSLTKFLDPGSVFFLARKNIPVPFNSDTKVAQATFSSITS